MKIEIKNRFTGEVIFSYNQEYNSLRLTVMEAINHNIDLREADLHGVDLRHANLSDINLQGADLHGSDLYGAYLRGASLQGSYLRGSNLQGVDLHEANLCRATLCRSNLCGANLCRSNLNIANLCSTNLQGANLQGANLQGADFYGADLQGAKINYPMVCPMEGSFIGWKKVKGKLIKLEIPEDAKRSSATTNKCRCSKAKVLSITDLDGNNSIDKLHNDSYTSIDYIVGEVIYPDSFDENRWNGCSNGIHFFMTKEEAINY